MITQLKLINFRNFENKVLEFSGEKNFVIWENGKWKTNILEAISLLANSSLSHIEFDNLVKRWEEYFFIECNYNNATLSLSYDKEKKQKKYQINGKSTTRKKFLEESYRCCIFSPIMMNMMYLSPSLRRDFIDQILINSFPEYQDILKEYKKVVKHRNKLLKHLWESWSDSSELDFWDEKFATLATEVYNYRFKIINFFKENIESSKEYFTDKVDHISFEYITKIDADSPKSSIMNYLKENRGRDIIIGKTPIWPHSDDFDVVVDAVSLTQFASRWETKSVILWLKLLETVFTEKKTNKKPVLVIDDLLSELDTLHKEMYTKKIKYYQAIISSIELTDSWNIIRL